MTVISASNFEAFVANAARGQTHAQWSLASHMDAVSMSQSVQRTISLRMSQIRNVFVYTADEEIHGLRQMPFTNEQEQEQITEDAHPELRGILVRNGLLAELALHREMEEFGRKFMTNTLTAAQTALQTARQAGEVGVEVAEAWADVLALYQGLTKNIKVPEFVEFKDPEKDKPKDEL
jgi:hypothetical protein